MSFLVVDEVEPAAVIQETTGWFLLIDGTRPANVQNEIPGGDFLLVDVAPEVSVVEASRDFLVIDAAPKPASVWDNQVGNDLVIIQSGGPKGDKGDQGDPGVSGYFYTRSFASPDTVWILPHNFGVTGLQVDTYDGNGEKVLGEVSFPSDVEARVTFYYAMTGYADVWR